MYIQEYFMYNMVFTLGLTSVALSWDSLRFQALCERLWYDCPDPSLRDTFIPGQSSPLVVLCSLVTSKGILLIVVCFTITLLWLIIFTGKINSFSSTLPYLSLLSSFSFLSLRVLMVSLYYSSALLYSPDLCHSYPLKYSTETLNHDIL